MSEHRYAERRVRELLAKGWTRTNIVRRVTQEIRWIRQGRMAQSEA